MIRLEVDITAQTMTVLQHDNVFRVYSISSAKNGVGEVNGSEQTPRGLHLIRAKIGADMPVNTVFVQRRPTGEIYHLNMREQFPTRDWILTRIFWLSGLEKGKNRLGNVDTMRRYIYIHGAPDEVKMGIPGSRGCIRMRNQDIIELFNIIPIGSKIFIK